MEFALVCIGLIVVLGVIAWIANHFDEAEDQGGTCTGDGT